MYKFCWHFSLKLILCLNGCMNGSLKDGRNQHERNKYLVRTLHTTVNSALCRDKEERTIK